MWGDISNIDNDLYDESKKILVEIRKIKDNIFGLKKRSERTRLIKKTLIGLGHKLKYKVYANGLSDNDIKELGEKFVNKEWLFDLQWYTEPDNVYKKNKGYRMLSLNMVMECEWDIKRKYEKVENEYSAMKYDFQKIICSNAKLQVMIFKLKEENDIQNIDKHINSLLSIYKNITKESIVLIIGFRQKNRKVYYREVKITGRI